MNSDFAGKHVLGLSVVFWTVHVYRSYYRFDDDKYTLARYKYLSVAMTTMHKPLTP